MVGRVGPQGCGVTVAARKFHAPAGRQWQGGHRWPVDSPPRQSDRPLVPPTRLADAAHRTNGEPDESPKWKSRCWPAARPCPVHPEAPLAPKPAITKIKGGGSGL